MGDIDPEADVLARGARMWRCDYQVTDFLSLLQETFGTLEVAWKDGFHQDPHGSITKKALVEAT